MGAFLVPTWLDAHRAQLPAAVLDRRTAEWTPAASAAAWARTLDDIAGTDGHPSCVLVAEGADGAVVALGMVTAVGDGTALIDALYVGADERGSGLGRQLLAELARIAAADGATSLAVDVLAANAPARDFYEHHGAVFVADGSVDDDGVSLPSVTYRWADVSPLLEVAS